MVVGHGSIILTVHTRAVEIAVVVVVYRMKCVYYTACHVVESPLVEVEVTTVCVVCRVECAVIVYCKSSDELVCGRELISRVIYVNAENLCHLTRDNVD